MSPEVAIMTQSRLRIKRSHQTSKHEIHHLTQKARREAGL